jgi:VanZ family protein
VKEATGTGKKVLYFLPATLYCAAIFYFSSKTISIDVGISNFDKFLHGLEFGGLGFLLALGFFRTLQHSMKLRIGVSWGAGLVLGTLDEFHQTFVPGRQSDVLDLLADAVGSALGVLIFILIARKIKLPH